MADQTPNRRSPRRRQRRRRRKKSLYAAEITLLAVIGAALFLYSKLNLIDTETLDESRVASNTLAEETEVTFAGYTTIACFGLDNRDQGNYEGGNSDVIMVININNDTKEVSIVSVYRDTFLDVSASDEEPSFHKANAAYSKGGPEQAITMLNRNLDLEIDNYVAFDFQAVADAIDILGGVEVTIESEEEMGYLNHYSAETAQYLGQDYVECTQTGTQTLNGVQAVAYSRIRYTAGDDYRRAERQRWVLSQMVSNAKNAGAGQLLELVDTVFPTIRTDLDKSDIVNMMTVMIKYDFTGSSGFPYNRTTKVVGGKGDCVIPCDLESNVRQLHQNLFGTESYEPSETVKSYSQHIIDETGLTSESAADDRFTNGDSFVGGGDESTDGSTDGSTDESTDGSTDGSTDESTDGSTDGSADGSTDGVTD